jgi:hypothetical protein
MRYELSDYEWTVIKPMLPNKPRGVRRVNERRLLIGIFWVLRSGAPWRDLPETHHLLQSLRSVAADRRLGPGYGCALAAGHDAAMQMIDTSIVRSVRTAQRVHKNPSATTTLSNRPWQACCGPFRVYPGIDDPVER